MLSVKNLLFLAVAVSGTVIQRAPPATPEDIQILNKDLQAITSATSLYNGRSLQPITKAVDTYVADVKKTVKDIDSKGPFSEPVTAKLISYIKSDFLPNAKKGFEATRNKKPSFKTSRVIPQVVANLKSSYKATKALVDALLAHAPANKKAQIKDLLKEYEAAYEKTIKIFS
ncbi:hypothetical protein E4U42_001358 [Claviceps africana]|uniref:Uncharacterized protein n=1 Tax=Claviceps africana TaxID=83212 RepID=A0A8K0JDJ6_9HYPO|nr:hypothetical protein E4U42_001358 [Claviceps africana]